MSGEDKSSRDLRKEIDGLKKRIVELESTIELQNDFFEAVPYRIAILEPIDGESSILFANDMMIKNFNCSKEEFIGKDMNKLLPTQLTKSRSVTAWDAYNSKKIVSNVDQRAGRWLRTKFIPTIDSDDTPRRIIVFVEDITEYKEQLLASEEKYQQIVDNINDGILVMNLNKRFTFINQIALKRLEMSEEEAYKHTFKDIIEPEYLDILNTGMKSIFKGEKVAPVEVKYRSKTGVSRDIEISATAIYGGKKIVGVQCITKDITHKKKAQQELIDSEEKYRSIFEYATEGMLVSRVDGKIVDVNPSAVRMLGYEDKRELVGRLTERLYAFDQERIDLKDKLDETGVASNTRITLLKKDRKQMKVSASVSRLRYASQEWAVAIFSDLTKLIAAQKEIKRSKEYLEKIIDSASEIVFVIDSDLKVTAWNEAAEILTGFKKKEVIAKKIQDLRVFSPSPEMFERATSCFYGEPYAVDDIVVETKEKERRLLRPSCSYMNSEEGVIEGILLICKDITEDIESHRKMRQGLGYLVVKDAVDSAINIFEDLVFMDRDGLFISREVPEVMKSSPVASNVKIVIMNQQKKEGYDYCFDQKSLVDTIKGFVDEKESAVVLLTRIEYMMVSFSFEELMQAIYKIQDIISEAKGILLVEVDPEVFDARQLAILHEELSDVPCKKIEEVIIDADHFGILKYIYRRGSLNMAVSFTDVSNHFSISKVTASKRIKLLEDLGIISIKKRGRINMVHVTKIGKELLHHREIL